MLPPAHRHRDVRCTGTIFDIATPYRHPAASRLDGPRPTVASVLDLHRLWRAGFHGPQMRPCVGRTPLGEGGDELAVSVKDQKPASDHRLTCVHLISPHHTHINISPFEVEHGLKVIPKTAWTGRTTPARAAVTVSPQNAQPHPIGVMRQWHYVAIDHAKEDQWEPTVVRLSGDGDSAPNSAGSARGPACQSSRRANSSAAPFQRSAEWRTAACPSGRATSTISCSSTA